MQTIPFSPFFTALRKNGFAVTQEQVISCYKTILKYGNKVHTQEELYLYLSPIFAKSEDEQKRFKEIFEDAFTFSDMDKIKPSFRSRFVAQGKSNPILLITAYSVIAAFVISIIIMSYKKYTAVNTGRLMIYVTDARDPSNLRISHDIFHLRLGETLRLNTVCYYKNRESDEFTLSTVADWGEGKPPTNELSHTYDATGEYSLDIVTTVYHGDEFIQKTVLPFRVVVCTDAKLSLLVSEKQDTIPVGKKIQLSAVAANAEGYDTVWIDNMQVLGGGKQLTLQYNNEGTHRITCRLKPRGQHNVCTIEESVEFTIAGYSDPSMKPDTVAAASTAATAKPGIPVQQEEKNDRSFLYALYGALAFIFLGAFIFFFIQYQKTIIVKTGWKKPEENRHLQLAMSPPVKPESKEIRFEPKNYLITEEPPIHEMAKSLRRRIHDNILLLDIKKTIRRSIEACGLLQIVKAPSSRQPEYLVLVDENNNNHGMTKLFACFSDQLKKYNLAVEKFHFNNTPDICFSATEPLGISFDKLSIRYSKHVLLVFADASCFVKDNEKKVRAVYEDMLHRWQYKALITPACYVDWSDAENILQNTLPVLPADIDGLLMLPNVLQQEINANRFTQHRSYSAAGIDFENIAELEAYCRQASWGNMTEHDEPVNILFEWIKALSVYPKIHWEVIVAMGKAILDRYNMPQELNFSNLLHIVRISWVNQATFPDNIRIELLKSLSKKNEVVARETIIKLLNETATDVAPGTPQYEEREIQLIVNEFQLYAHNPVRYAQYRRAKTSFERMLKDDTWNDRTAKYYLTNKDRLWQTLVEHSSVKGNMSLDQYFEAAEIEETNLSRLYLWLTIISVMVMVGSFFALLIVYRWDRAGL